MMFDAHTHLQDRQFDPDREDVIRRTFERGIRAIQVGTDVAMSRGALALAETHDGFWAAVGQHPTDTGAGFDADAFEELARHPKVVAIGECGLDYYRGDQSDRARQAGLFRAQIALARAVGKPLMIHCRPSLNSDKTNSTDAYDDVFQILKEEGEEGGSPAGGALHFFVGATDVARKFLDIGFYVSFSGVITLTNMYDDVARFVPSGRILVETDAPYAAPAPHRGTRNESLYIIEVVRRLAELRGVSPEEIERVTEENARRLFRLP